MLDDENPTAAPGAAPAGQGPGAQAPEAASAYDGCKPLSELGAELTEKQIDRAAKVLRTSKKRDMPQNIPRPWNGHVEIACKLAEKGTLTTEDIEVIIGASGYTLSFNSILMRPEWANSIGVKKPMGEGDHAQIVENCRIIGEFSRNKVVAHTLCNTKTIDRAITLLIHSTKVNPILAYFNHLFCHNNEYKLDAFDMMAHHFRDKDGMSAAFIKKWMMGCVARVFLQARGGYQNYMLVLQGAQGLGKSFWAKWLCGGLGNEYFQEGIVLPGDKDHRLRLAMKFMWAIDEFGETGGPHMRNQLKAFVTQESINERPPYGHYTISLPRQCNLIATTNDSEIFNDPTGSRRYLTLQMTEIDHSYSSVLTPDDVWADIVTQTCLAISRGETPWVLTDEERAQQKLGNAGAEVEGVVETFLNELLIADKDAKMEASVLYSYVKTRFDAHQNQREEDSLIKQTKVIVTKKFGAEQNRVKNVRYFHGVRRNPECDAPLTPGGWGRKPE